MILDVVMTWGERDRKWAMTNAKTGHFLYDFWDCDNFNRVFHGIDKTKANAYTLTVRRTRQPHEAAPHEARAQ